MLLIGVVGLLVLLQQEVPLLLTAGGDGSTVDGPTKVWRRFCVFAIWIKRAISTNKYQLKWLESCMFN